MSDRKETAINFPTVPEPIEGQTAGYQRILDQQIALGYTGSFGANRLLDVRLGISRTKAGKTPVSEGTSPVLVNGAPIPGLGSLPTAFQGGLPAVSISGGFTTSTGSAYIGRQTTNPQFQNPALLDPSVAYTWVKGKHSLKFGYEYEHIWMGVFDNNPPYGSFTFGGSYSNSEQSHRCLLGRISSSAQPAHTLWHKPSRPIFARHSTAFTCRTIGRCFPT